MSHFVDGYLISRGTNPDGAMIQKVYEAWTRTLILAPSFQGPSGITAAALRGRLKEMGAALEQSGLAIPEVKAPTAPAQPPASPTSAPEAPGDATKVTEASAPDVDTVGEDNVPERPEGVETASTNETDAQPTPDGGDATGSKSAANPVLIEAEARLALGDYAAAGELFQQVLKREPGNKKAEFGFTMALWNAPGERDEKASALLERVASRQDLTAQELFKLGLIYQRKLKDKPSALQIWRRVKGLDPAFASSVGIDKLLSE